MLTSQNEIRSRVDQLKMSLDGYSKQLRGLTLSEERRERLRFEVDLYKEEVGTLEKVLQVGRVEVDRARIETIVRDRLAEVRQRLEQNPDWSELTPQARDTVSGEVRALLWMLGEDLVTQGMRDVMRGRTERDPTRTERAMPTILINTLREAPDPETRAGAAYELGSLHIVEAIPHLVECIPEGGLIARAAYAALGHFSDADLANGGASAELLEKLRAS